VGSLRRPVGPLPSSIYWRRRLVVLLGVALLVLLVIWALTSVGSGDEPGPTGDDHAGGPAQSITPGPTPSESFIDERPGGREEPEPGEGGETGEGGDVGGGGDDGGAGGAGETGDDSGGATGGEGSTGSAGSATGGGGDPGDVTGLPACGPGDVSLSLTSQENEYGLDEEPELLLTVENVSGVSCAVDFGYGALTVTITDADAEQVWSSADCPEEEPSLPVAVWAGGSATHTIAWDRRVSTGECGGEPGAAVPAGANYLAEATLSGISDVPQAPFRLDDD
jgi:hypothetical protein